ncbi:MAG TPA: cysteine peptidase family C39 domain-containing protein [Syntrophales bacterium]|nr:cysteine peptidase family C39 domain-containing protein [Syntrophales bacterium]
MKKIIIFLLLLASNALAFEIEGVPFIQQDSQFCGPVALASVMSYYGNPVDQKIIGSRVYSEKLQGALITDLERYARDAGFETNSGQGTVEGLKAEINRRRPVIVLVDRGFWVLSRTHYLVIFGHDNEGLIAHDGFSASKRYRYDEFREIWGKMGNAYLLVYKKRDP